MKGNLEDVAVHAPSGRLVLLAEKKGELVVWDPASARETARFPLDVAAVLGKEPADRNQGFEGLGFREDAGGPAAASSTSCTRGSPRAWWRSPSIPRGPRGRSARRTSSRGTP